MLKENSGKTELAEYLKELRLPVVRSCYETVAQQAVQESLSYENYLLQVVERECEVRWQNRIERRLRESKLPIDKSLKSFDLKRLPTKVHQQVNSLMEGSFVDRRENILAFGNPGSGKTHLLCAIAQELIRQNRRVLYTTSSTLVQELLRAKRNLVLPRLLKKLGMNEVLFIDDIGYVQQNREEMEVLFTLLADRYERGSILITSNLPFSGWEAIFKDPMTTAAAIDRLVHHSIILELNLPSYRMEQAKKTKGQIEKKKGLGVAEDNVDSCRDNGE
jgi:DNA replication protein DnaC